MRITEAGRALLAKPWVSTPNGLRASAGDLAEALCERSIRLNAPNFMRNSIAGTCALYGGTTGREKRDRERFVARVTKERVA